MLSKECIYAVSKNTMKPTVSYIGEKPTTTPHHNTIIIAVLRHMYTDGDETKILINSEAWTEIHFLTKIYTGGRSKMRTLKYTTRFKNRQIINTLTLRLTLTT